MDRKFIILVAFASAAYGCVKSVQVEACTGTTNELEIGLTTIGDVFIKDSLLNETRTVAALYIAQCALQVATSKVENSVAAIFTEVTDLLIRLSVLLDGESKNNFSASATAKSRTASEFIIANLVLFNAVAATQPNASSIVAAAQEELFIRIPVLVNNYYSAIDLALNQETSCSETLENIEAFKITQVAVAENLVQSTYDVILNNQTFDGVLKSQLTTLQQQTNTYLKAANTAAFEAYKILARAFCSNDGVTDNDFFAVQTYAKKAISAGVDFTDTLVTAALLAAA